VTARSHPSLSPNWTLTLIHAELGITTNTWWSSCYCSLLCLPP
ncbi:unnamed protein product, partial [Musa textilis]